MSALISAGCDVNKPSHVARSRAIHWAVSAADCVGSMECLRLLLDAGADIEARVTSRRTALMMAARAGHDEALDLLIQHGLNDFTVTVTCQHAKTVRDREVVSF